VAGQVRKDEWEPGLVILPMKLPAPSMGNSDCAAGATAVRGHQGAGFSSPG
jgi:hypothetical protein